MKRFTLALLCLCLSLSVFSQEKKSSTKTEAVKNNLASIRKCIQTEQGNLGLFVQNLKDHSKETDVLFIVNTAEQYLDSTAKSREYNDVLLRKHFVGMRNFFLTVSNKTTIATSFLYPDAPYHFCMYNDTALGLYISAMKDGDVYSAKDMSEKKIASKVFEDCVLPALKALNEFKDNELKYFGLSVYYGCKDIKQIAPDASGVKPYCLTFVARFPDVKKYIEGYMTADDMVDNAEVYISNDDSINDLRRIRVNIE
jgi:hypothetical protein